MTHTFVACAGLLFPTIVVGGDTLSAEQATGTVSGTVVDQLGSRLPATVVLRRYGEVVEETRATALGEFRFEGVSEGRYRVEGHAGGFEPSVSGPFFVGAGAMARVSISLSIGPIEQHVVVTAAATDLPQSQSGSPVTVISRDTLENLAKVDVVEALRLVPGTIVVQSGRAAARPPSSSGVGPAISTRS